MLTRPLENRKAKGPNVKTIHSYITKYNATNLNQVCLLNTYRKI